MKIYISILLILISVCYGQEKKVTDNFELKLETEYRYFPNNAAFEGQKDHFLSLAVSPEYSLSWNKEYDVLHFKGFFRLDVDEKRIHWDIRELYYQKSKNNWEYPYHTAP